MRFALDRPPSTGGECVVRSPFVVAGWVIPQAGHALTGVRVEIGGQLRARAVTGLRRPDVEKEFPHEPSALWSGFAAEVFADDVDSSRVIVVVRATVDDGDLPLARFQAKVVGLDGECRPG